LTIQLINLFKIRCVECGQAELVGELWKAQVSTSNATPVYVPANCIVIIAQVPIENHSDQGQFAELPLKTIGKVQNMGDCYAIRSVFLLSFLVKNAMICQDRLGTNGRKAQ
jgi:hypothetical protein